MISVIIPSNNEEGYIGTCLDLILGSRAPEGSFALSGMQVIVVANGCKDATAEEALARKGAFVENGWALDVLDLNEGSKIIALNAGDAAALHNRRVYIDADIHVTPDLIAQISETLDRPEPAYAGGRPQIRRAHTFVSERYARFWERLPFMATGVPGCGVYGVNAAGRARWNDFPMVIADDSFVRHHFRPHEMYGVPATYSWPITEGFGNLVRVRRRQDQGLEEIRKLRPDLANDMERTAPTTAEKLHLLVRDPIGFMIYATVALTVRLPIFQNRATWERGR